MVWRNQGGNPGLKEGAAQMVACQAKMQSQQISEEADYLPSSRPYEPFFASPHLSQPFCLLLPVMGILSH